MLRNIEVKFTNSGKLGIVKSLNLPLLRQELIIRNQVYRIPTHIGIDARTIEAHNMFLTQILRNI
jgi:hypothetical protein